MLLLFLNVIIILLGEIDRLALFCNIKSWIQTMLSLKVLLIGTEINMWIKNNLGITNTYGPLLLKLLNVLNILNVNYVFADINFILTWLSLFARAPFSAFVFWFCFLVLISSASGIDFLELSPSRLNNRLWSLTSILRLKIFSNLNVIVILRSLDEAVCSQLNI